MAIGCIFIFICGSFMFALNDAQKLPFPDQILFVQGLNPKGSDSKVKVMANSDAITANEIIFDFMLRQIYGVFLNLHVPD